jgi:hypothetical protein
MELVLVLAQSEHVTRNLFNSLIVAPRHQAATWLLAVSAAKQQPAASPLFGALPICMPELAEFVNWTDASSAIYSCRTGSSVAGRGGPVGVLLCVPQD